METFRGIIVKFAGFFRIVYWNHPAWVYTYSYFPDFISCATFLIDTFLLTLSPELTPIPVKPALYGECFVLTTELQ